MTNQSVFAKYKTIIILVALALAAICIGLFIAGERLETYETKARLQATEQEAVLVTIAETIARNGADAVTESIIKDCPLNDRTRFDTLLGQLDSGLSFTELRELDQLFGACASFSSDRKALMVARFAREIEIYSQQISLLNSLTTSNEVVVADLESWETLLEEEQTQSALFAELVVAQKEIIDALILGSSPQSEEISAILANVNETKEALVFSRQKAATARESLSNL